MATKIFMVRHGYSISNNSGYFTGQVDIELTEIGREQARRCGNYFKGVAVDRLYASDLLRTIETAQPIAECTGLPIRKEAGLREIYAGDWEAVAFDELERRFPEEYKIWQTDIGRAYPAGGEKVTVFARRIWETVCRLAKENDGKTICLVTHATPIRVICTLAAGFPIEDMARIPWVSNASINEFTYEQGVFKPNFTNYTEHLGELQTGLPKNV